jgi:bacterial/archaeal transporter family protein
MSSGPFTAWQIWALLSAGFAALTAVLAKVGVEAINPDLATFVRTLVVAASLGLILLATGVFREPLALTPRTALFLTLSGLATGASWLCYFRALKLGPASLVAPIDKLSVVLVALFAFVFLGERPSASGWAGIALIAAGAIVLAVKR